MGGPPLAEVKASGSLPDGSPVRWLVAPVALRAETAVVLVVFLVATDTSGRSRHLLIHFFRMA